jgi:hypothetical protein
VGFETGGAVEPGDAVRATVLIPQVRPRFVRARTLQSPADLPSCPAPSSFGFTSNWRVARLRAHEKLRIAIEIQKK